MPFLQKKAILVFSYRSRFTQKSKSTTKKLPFQVHHKADVFHAVRFSIFQFQKPPQKSHIKQLLFKHCVEQKLRSFGKNIVLPSKIQPHDLNLFCGFSSDA